MIHGASSPRRLLYKNDSGRFDFCWGDDALAMDEKDALVMNVFMGLMAKEDALITSESGALAMDALAIRWMR